MLRLSPGAMTLSRDPAPVRDYPADGVKLSGKSDPVAEMTRLGKSGMFHVEQEKTR